MQRILGTVSILHFGAAFGFFYAWICSTMWGLDQIDPVTAITAMNGMNASVRNGVFFPVFFLTPVFGFIMAAVLFAAAQKRAALFFGLAGLTYLCGGLGLTVLFAIPMNEALAVAVIPETAEGAAQMWADYSSEWQIWNITRTVFCGIALALATFGLLEMRRD